MNRSNCSSGFSEGRFFLGIAHFLVRRSIGQALTNDAAHHLGSALFVVDATGNAIVIPEIELRKVAVQVLLITVLVDALHATLKDRKIAFQGVGVGIAANVRVGAAESDATRTVIPIHCGHHSDDRGQLVMSG